MDFIEVNKNLFIKKEDISSVSVEHGRVYLVLNHGYVDENGYLKKTHFIDCDTDENKNRIKNTLLEIGIDCEGVLSE